MGIKAQHIFTGLDTDTADRFMQKGSFRDSLNIHIGSSESDGMFSVENVKGNTFVNYALPPGTNQIIGAHEDIANKCIYYFLCNSSILTILSTSGITVTTTTNHGLVLTDLVTIAGTGGRTNIIGDWIVSPIDNTRFQVLNPLTYADPTNQTITDILLPGTSGAVGTITKYGHSILKYDSIANSISLVWQHSRFNFKPDSPITGTAYLNNILHWTDGYNPPRSLDQSILATVGSYFTESVVDFIKLPPTIPPTAIGKWVDKNGVVVPYSLHLAENNNMNDKSYQFIYRYVYSDNVRSVWSPVSETITTGYNDSKINKIEITFSLPIFFGSVVKSIEIAFRDDILDNFKYIDRITSNPAIYDFYNDTAYSIIDSSETSKFFDAVPKVVSALSSVQNRVFVGNCTEGFDVNKNDFFVDSVSIITDGTLEKDTIVWKDGEPYDVGIVYFDRAERKCGVYKLFRTIITDTGNGDVAPTFILSGIPPIWATHFRIVRSDCLSKSFFVQGYMVIRNKNENNTTILFNSINGALSYNAEIGDILLVANAKTGNKDQYPILQISADKYGNPTIIVKGRIPLFSAIGNFQTIECEIYTPLTSKSQLSYETPFTYPILNPGTPQRSFTGTLGTQIRLKDYESGDVYYRNLNDSIVYHARTTIEIRDLSTATAITNNQIYVTFSSGDTFFATVDRSGTTFAEEKAALDLIDQINGSPFYRAFMLIADYFDTGLLRNLGHASGIVMATSRIVVYDNRKGTLGDMLITGFSLAGMNYGVLTGIHEIIDANRVTPKGAQNFMDNNFVYSMSSNDKDLTWNKNIGRANIVLTDGDKEIKRTTLIRFGGKFLTDTQINFVNSFDSLDSEPLTNSGQIRKLIPASNNAAEGTILLAIQENEISSCYIGQAIIKTAGGGSQLVSTDKVIGTVNPLQKLVGTINPESVVQYNGLVYGFDALKGIVWRYGQDGLQFLSDLGMKNVFYKKSQYLLSLGTFKCYGGIDPYHNEYIITFPSTDIEKRTLAWSENLNRWTSYMNYLPEWMQKVNTHIVSFINGQLWLHNSNALANNFYGVQYKSKLRMICNQEPDITKILHIVEQKATSSWDCTNISTPEGQSSELLGIFDIANPNNYPQDFRKYDNTTYIGNVMRDKNTPNFQLSDNALQNGDAIRSDVFSVLMENSRTTKENLYFVNLEYIPSYKRQ